MLNRVIKFFGSLKLAVVLLTTLTVILAVGTFYESSESTRAAMLNVYRTWWFNGLLALLAINVAAAALTRWPWKRKHIGFVVTHAGIIVLLGGCSAAFHYGTEGMLELHVGEPPANLVRLDEEALTAVVPETGVREKTEFRVRRDGAVRPRVVQLEKDLRLTLDEYIPNTRTETVITEGATARNPAIQFRLQSEMAQQDLSQWLLADSSDLNRLNMGPAEVEFVTAANDAELKRLTTVPDEAAKSTPEIQILLGQKPFTVDVTGSLGKHLDLGDTGVGVHIMGYWPDFRLDENHKPSSASDEPNNPAAVLILTRGEDEQRWFVFASGQMAPIVKTIKGQPIDATVSLTAGAPQRRGSVLTLVLGPDDKLYFAANSKNGFKSGPVTVGAVTATGWMDFEFTVLKYVSNALVSQKTARAPEDTSGAFPALLVSAETGGARNTEMVVFGRPAVIQAGGKTVHLMFSWDTMPLPFTVSLEDFVVERDEGSMNVAGWTSKVVFHDDARGLSQRASVWMNNPAWFKGYKFSQASWNPNDLKYTALQVKKDPRFVTWLTWTGAILICCGIAMMFWFRKWYQGGGSGGGKSKAGKSQTKEMVTA